MDNTTPFQPWAADGNSKNVKTERELVDDAKLHRENVNHPKHRQTASYDKEIVDAPSVVPGPSSSPASGANPVGGKEPKMDSGKVASMQQIVENTLSQEGRQRVSQILEAVEALSGAERLLLYLRLPTGVPPHDPLKQPINPLGSRAELQQTVTWIQTHLEVDPDVSLPKQDVYDEYIAHCMSSNMKPLSTADFGKVMKQVYPSVRPRRLGTRGNSRYCYAGLRKKIKLEVPHLPDLGESSKEPTVMKESERIVCEWAESKFGIKFVNITELSRHLVSPLGPAGASPPHASHGPPEETPSPQLMKQQLKRKLQGTPGRPKKNKGQEVSGESPPSTSYVGPQLSVKHESEMSEPAYAYQPGYGPVYDVRQPYPYAPPPRAHPHAAPHPHSAPHPHAAPHTAPPPHATPPAPHPPLVHDYRPDPYAFEPTYAPRDLTVPDTAHNLPINLSSDASLDLSTERGAWPRRRPPEPPAARLPLPGKKLILETYQSETQAGSPRAAPQPAEEFPRTEYLPKKMRAAEILGGKLSAARQALASAASEPAASSSSAGAEPSLRPEGAFLEDPKNLTSRSKSTAAALAREEQEAASPTRSGKAPTPRCDGARARRRASPQRPAHPATPDSCCGLDGISMRTGMICEEKHSEILNRERVISICNIDKHDLDDYLNEGSSQEHEEELLQYFHQRGAEPAPAAHVADAQGSFLETGQDPHDEHSQGKSEKISQLRELLAKNLKNQSGSNAQNVKINQISEKSMENCEELHGSKTTVLEGAFKPLGNGNVVEIVNGTNGLKENEVNVSKNCDTISNENGISVPCTPENNHNPLMTSVSGSHLYNGNCHNEPQSPTTRTQQYDFVPISDGCHSPGNFHSKSPLGFGQRGHSPTKTNKTIIMGGSLQTSPISHSTAASPFVSPRNTPVPRSRFCSRPIPKHNGRKKRNPLTLTDPCSKQFAIPNDQKFMPKTSLSGPNIKYCQPMSAPPSPNILSHYKQQMAQNSGIPNGGSNMCLSFIPNAFRDNINGELATPLSADPLSSEVSRFFQEPVVNYRLGHDTSFRSQSVPLKQAPMNIGLLSYTNTPVGSVPPTPVPNEFCDFGSLADTCDISKAGLNPETLDKIYDAIDSSNGVLNAGASTAIMNTNDALTNGCDPLPEQQILTDDQLHSLIPVNNTELGRSAQYSESFPTDATNADDVEEFLKRTNTIDYDLSELVTEKNKYYTSRSVPSTPLPYKRTAPNLQIDSRLSRELFTAENYSNISNGISSKSVPSTPQLAEDRSVFSYSNRDFLINGNSVDMCNSNQMRSVENDQGLTSPLDMLREDILVDPMTPSIDPLLADLDKMDGTPYVDL
ncbi:uncharacterized protein LOC123864549 isoform X2 [Maniola jurtina]|uniref:uncharacterized protein LOC123864549 isoform X2 n=1 Tax=Maniola jurtina TaxID=191418 RepID=UPI001E68922B|nr:uncharacterized protein LOC123864549 isoform X2 [Maniola jurtina]